MMKLLLWEGGFGWRPFGPFGSIIIIWDNPPSPGCVTYLHQLTVSSSGDKRGWDANSNLLSFAESLDRIISTWTEFVSRPTTIRLPTYLWEDNYFGANHVMILLLPSSFWRFNVLEYFLQTSLVGLIASPSVANRWSRRARETPCHQNEESKNKTPTENWWKNENWEVK